MMYYRTHIHGQLDGYHVLVDGEEVRNVFAFDTDSGEFGAYFTDDPCPACGHVGGGKHLRYWGAPEGDKGIHYQEWGACGDGRVYPIHPDPAPCWYEGAGEIRVTDSEGNDVTDVRFPIGGPP